MGKLAALVGIVAALAAVAVGRPSPAGSGGLAPGGPDGLLVLGAIGERDRGGAVTGELAMVADPRSGAVRSYRLPGGTLCGGTVLPGGDGVVFPRYAGRRAVALSLPLGLRGRPRSLGRAELLAPAGAAGRLLLGRAGYRRRLTVLRDLRELGPNGTTPLAERLELPGWAALEGRIDGALLVTYARSLALWDIQRARPRRVLRRAHLLAAGERSFAWCRGRCRTLGLSTPDGERRLAAPAGTRAEYWIRGQLSPDERRLAVALRTRAGSRVAVLHLARRSWTFVPGGRIGAYRAMAWSPSGEWLYFTTGRRGGRSLMAWRRGTQRALPLGIRVPDAVMSLATI